jgi:HEAT repeat protein
MLHAYSRRLVIGLIIAVLALVYPASGQLARVDQEIANLIQALDNKDERLIDHALKAIVAIGPPAIPRLQQAMREKASCEVRFAVSLIVRQIEPADPNVFPVLVDVVKGLCDVRSREDLLARREAAFALVEEPEGIRLLAQMLSDKNTLLRRTAAFAFDDLTERLDGRPLEIVATSKIITATLAALPELIKALVDSDEIVRCMCDEALEQMKRSKHQTLRSEATRLGKDASARCSN